MRLAQSIDGIKDRYQVVVVGSGYGASIAASRMARAGQSVCVLERGRELRPGQYPDTEPGVIAEIQVDAPGFSAGSRTGLYDFRFNRDMNVFLGCGLGGTSLVNAGVALRARPEVLGDARWPRSIREDPDSVERGYQEALRMLASRPCPDTRPPLLKATALRQAGGGDDDPARFYQPPLNVTWQDGTSVAGVAQKACTRCGDCVTGCNVGAKNSLLMNYLPDARSFGAEIFTEVCVSHVERAAGAGGQWLVHYQATPSGHEARGVLTGFVRAEVVVLGAGSLGSTEILLRSRARGLAVSPRVGERFSANGDYLGFVYSAEGEVNGVGLGRSTPRAEDPLVGPAITSIVDLRAAAAAPITTDGAAGRTFEDGLVIEEGAIPGALLPLSVYDFGRQYLRAGGRAEDLPFFDGGFEGPPEPPAPVEQVQQDLAALQALSGDPREHLPGAAEIERFLFDGRFTSALRRTLTCLVISFDDGRGVLRLDDGDRLRIDWPGVGRQPTFARAEERLRQMAAAVRGTFLPNPITSPLVGNRQITVHPLGGCVMADDAQGGVVDHKGQVFRGEAGADLHDGLFVLDGAIVPMALGINPLLTISALVERACVEIARDRGWSLATETRAVSATAESDRAASHPVGIRFTERMSGHLSLHEQEDYTRGDELGRRDGSIMEFTLTMTAPDLDRFIAASEHQVGLSGIVVAPALSERPLSVTEGAFNFVVDSPSVPGGKEMWYRMKLSTVDGRSFWFAAVKRMRGDDLGDPLHELSTLYVTLHDGDSAAAPVLGKGILRIGPLGVARIVASLRPVGAADHAQGLETVTRFGRFYFGSLWSIYGV